MSLEERLAENTAALKAHTEILTKVYEGQGKVLAAATSVSEKASTKAADKKAADKPAETPKTETTEAGAPTQADVMAKCVAYAKGAATDAEKAARKGKVEDLLKKVNVADLKALEPKHYAGFIKAMDVLIAAGNVLAEEPAGEPETAEDPFG